MNKKMFSSFLHQIMWASVITFSPQRNVRPKQRTQSIIIKAREQTKSPGMHVCIEERIQSEDYNGRAESYLLVARGHPFES